MYQRHLVKFCDKSYILLGDPSKDRAMVDYAVYMVAAINGFKDPPGMPFAVLKADGTIVRFGKTIGFLPELDFCGELP